MVFVLIATSGRAPLIDKQIAHLRRQTRRPARIVLCPAAPQDVSESVRASAGAWGVSIATGGRGASAQRNSGLDLIFGALGAGDDDVVAMIDDDCVLRRDWLETSERVLAERPDWVGATGVLLDDGVQGPGLGFEEAEALLERGEARLPPGDWRRRPGEVESLYGCNMAVRGSAMRELRFDESLPLYGWLEDADLSGRLAQRGRLMRAEALVGVHLGVKAGRVSGQRLGYVQIAVPIHLMRKGTLSRGLGRRLMWNAMASNLARWPWPEPWVDRRGRLAGNLRALRDLSQGRCNPSRALEAPQ